MEQTCAQRVGDARIVVRQHIVKNSCHYDAFRDVPTVCVAKHGWGGYLVLGAILLPLLRYMTAHSRTYVESIASSHRVLAHKPE